jgi:hypothetical protein
MSHPLLAIVIATAYAVVFIFALALCVAAAKRPPVASRTDRLLGGDTDHLESGLLRVMDDDPTPSGRRHRNGL